MAVPARGFRKRKRRARSVSGKAWVSRRPREAEGFERLRLGREKGPEMIDKGGALLEEEGRRGEDLLPLASP